MADIKLVGSRFTSITAKRAKDFSGKISLKTGIHLGVIEQVKDAKDTVSVDFVFDVDYGSLGRIGLEGSLFIASDNNTLKLLLVDSKSRNLESKEFMAITNVVLQKASVKALELEDELNLPVHIRLPTISPSKK